MLESTGRDRQPKIKPKSEKVDSSAQSKELYKIATGHMKDKDYSEAAKFYHEAAVAGHGKPANCYVSAGTCWHLRGDDMYNSTKAIESFTAALQIDSKNGRALRGRTESYRRTFKWSEARADLDALRQVDPKMIGGLDALVEKEAKEQEAATMKIQAVRRGNEARKELDDSRTPEESRKLRDIRGEAESSPEAKEAFELGSKHLTEGAFDLAAESYGRALRLNYNRPSRCHNGAGLALSLMGQDEMALVEFSEAIELDPKDPRVYHNRAAVYKRLNRFPEAARDAAAANLMDPNDAVTKRLAAWAAAEACAVKIQAMVRGKRGRRQAADSRVSSRASSRAS